MTKAEPSDLETLARSRKRWRWTTAAVALVALWLLHGAGATIGEERATAEQQAQEIAVLKQKLGEAAVEMRKMGAVMAQSQQVIELFGKRMAEQGAMGNDAGAALPIRSATTGD